MNADELNALVTQSYEAAFSFEDELMGSYQRSFDRAAKAASSKFKSTAVTAAGFVSPPVDSLTSGMTDREKQQANDIRDKAAEAVAAALIALGLAAVSVSFLQAISERGQLNFEQELLRTLRTVVQQGLVEGWTADQTALAIQQAFTNVSSTTAQMLAQTELTTLVNERAMEAAQKVSGETREPMYKRWRCLLPNTRVQGLPVRVSRREQGEGGCAVSLTVSSGGFGDSTLPNRNLSVTTNHPILTNRGWVEAQFVEPGDRVFGCSAFDSESVMQPDKEDAPPTIVEVFHAACVSNPVERMMSTVVNLDGEWEDCEVEVVTIDGELRNRIASHLHEELPQILFSLSDLDLVDVFSDSNVGGCAFSSFPSPQFQSSFAGSDEGSVAVCDPPRFSGIRPSPDWDSTQREYPHHGLWGSTDLPSDFAERLTGFVAPLEVVSVEIIPWSGYVYNLETENRWFVADSIIVHNTVGDNRVRVAHAHAQGQTVPVDQPFHVEEVLMMYPGDPSAPMRYVARCRCRLSFTHSLTASAQEDTIVTMTVNELADLADEPFTFEDEPITAGLVVTIEETEVETPAGDTAEDGVEEVPMADGPAWRALLAVEGVPTEDGRMLAEGSLTWRDLPLSLMALDNTGPGGHEGAIVAGRIDRIWRDGNEVWGEGVFNSDEFGMHIAELVSNQSLRGNSIDPAVTKYEYRDAETGEVLDTNAMMDAMMEDRPVLTVFLEAIIMASTVCSTPAIGEANIMLASGILRAVWFQEQAVETLTASAAGMAPLHPPAAWFDDPRLDAPTPLTVTKEGRVYGHAALWNSCHIGEPSGPGVCVPPPRSGMNYEIFHHGACETAEGHDVPCGQITMSTLHASRDMGWKATLEHYEHSGCAVADVQAHEDRFGIVVAGGLRPDIPAEKVRELKAGSLSGDWRQVLGRGLEFLAALVVNIPGFPIPRPEARIVASAMGEEEVLALVAAGIVTVEDEQQMSRREYLRKIGVLTSE